MQRKALMLALACALPASQCAAGGNAFNPNLSLILTGTAADFKLDPNNYRLPGFALGDESDPGEEGFSLGESELGISANIDPDWFGFFTLSITGDNNTSVENAYVQTTSLGNGLTVRAGRFFSGVGYLNEQHSHTWDFVDTALPYRAFLNTQLGDDGVQLRWLAPTDLFTEFGTEWLRGDAFPAGGSANSGHGTWSAFVHVGGDLGESNSWSAGLSYLKANAANRDTSDLNGDNELLFNGETRLLIADLVWKWAPQGNPYDHNFKFQTEYLRREEDGDYRHADGGAIGGYDTTADGWYAQAIYQFMHAWRVGLRHDALHSDRPGAAFAGTPLDSQGHSPSRNSVMVDYSNSEFSRLRLQYNRDDSGPQTDDQWFVQYQMSLGAHGAHIF